MLFLLLPTDCRNTLPCVVQVEFWRKGASHQEEEQQWQQQQEQQQWRQQQHEQEWLTHDRGGGPVDTAQAAVEGSGDMMTQDMARWVNMRPCPLGKGLGRGPGAVLCTPRGRGVALGTTHRCRRRRPGEGGALHELLSHALYFAQCATGLSEPQAGSGGHKTRQELVRYSCGSPLGHLSLALHVSPPTSM